MYGENTVTDQACQKWSAKFCAGHFLLDVIPRVDQLRLIANNLIEDAERYTTREITDILETLKSSAENQLHQLPRANRFDV